MRLERLHLAHVDGLPADLRIKTGEAPVQVVLGANGTGKSTLAAAVAQTLWPGLGRGRKRRIEATSVWSIGGDFVEARLYSGEVSWSRGGGSYEPTLPSEALADCYRLRLRDLIGESGSLDGDIAEQLRREFRGGFDLEDARQVAGRPRPIDRKHAEKAHREALQERGRVEAAHRELGRRLDEKESLVREIKDSKMARIKAKHLEVARQFQQLRREHQEALQRLNHAEEAVGGVMEGDLEREGRLREDLERMEADVKRESECEVDLGRRIDQLGLGEHSIEKARLVELQAGAIELETLSRDLDQLGTDRRAVGLTLDETLSMLDLKSPPELNPRLLREVATVVERSEEHRRQAEELRRQLGEPPQDPEDTEALHEGVRVLRGWFRSLGVEKGSRSRTGILLALTLLACGLVGAVFEPLLAAASIGGIVMMIWEWRRVGFTSRPADTRVEDWPARFWSTQLKPPAAWEPVKVGARLEELEQRLAQARGADLRREAYRTLAKQVQMLDSEAEHIESERTRVLSEAGLPPDLQGLSARILAQRLISLEQTLRQVRDVDHRRQAKTEQLNVVAARLMQRLMEFGLQPESILELRAAVRSLLERAQELTGVIEERAQVRERLRGYGENLVERQEAMKCFYLKRSLQVGDQVGLAARSKRLPDLDSLRKEVEVMAMQIDQAGQVLKGAGEVALLKEDPVQLDLSIKHANQAASRYDKHHEALVLLEDEVRRTAEGSSMADALAAGSEADLALASIRERERFADAVAFMLDEIENVFELESRPKVLENTEALFSEVTRHRYGLELSRDKNARLMARESESGGLRELDELSDGTRAQLLLAARIAHALAHEARTPWPLFLDEVLSTADPERFHALAGALLALSAGGRQVFYLTANPHDFERWQAACREFGNSQPHLIDLRQVRGEAAVVVDATLHGVPTRAPVPSPEGMSAIEYGERLQAPLPLPFASAGSWHIVHALGNDLDYVRYLSEAGIETVGQLDTYLRRAAATLPAQDPRLAHARSSVRMVDAFVLAWKEGRPRPLDGEVLRTSTAVSSTFMDAVIDLLNEVRGDAVALMEVLAAGRVSSFGISKRRKLEDFLRTEGYLTQTQPHSREGLCAWILGELQEDASAGLLTPERVRMFVDGACIMLESDSASCRAA